MTKDLIRLFTDNAFLLLAHKRQIMKDSKMCFAPIDVSNGLAYSGAFRPATLGAYIEWWATCAEALRMNDAGEKSLVYRLAGSPLSGANRCMQVYEDGRTEAVSVDGFKELWKPFVGIVNRYARENECTEHYGLQEVVDILSVEERVNMRDYVHTLFLEAEVNKCKARLQTVEKCCDEYREKYVLQRLKNNEEQVALFYDKYLTMKREIAAKSFSLKEERRFLRRKLRMGEIKNVSYQRLLIPINKELDNLQYALTDFRSKSLMGLFPDERFTIEDIELYFESKKEKYEENSIIEKS